MSFEEIFKRVKQVAEENPDGFTIDLHTMELVGKGIAVAYDATQNQFNDDGLKTCITHALLNSGYIGGWKNPEGWMQYDSIRILRNLNKAVKWGRKQNQRAIYYIEKGWEITL